MFLFAEHLHVILADVPDVILLLKQTFTFYRFSSLSNWCLLRCANVNLLDTTLSALELEGTFKQLVIVISLQHRLD
jgi:hypothetical protein